MDKIDKGFNLLRDKKYNEAIGIFKKELRGKYRHELLYVAIGNAYFELEEWDSALKYYQTYVGIIKNNGLLEKFLFTTEIEPKMCILSRKISRCMQNLKGIKESKKYLLEAFDIFGHPALLDQLGVYLRESGNMNLANYYENESKKIWGNMDVSKEWY